MQIDRLAIIRPGKCSIDDHDVEILRALPSRIVGMLKSFLFYSFSFIASYFNVISSRIVAPRRYFHYAPVLRRQRRTTKARENVSTAGKEPHGGLHDVIQGRGGIISSYARKELDR